jgi:hypothetical protein
VASPPDYLHETGQPTNFEQFDIELLAKTLRSFYGSIRTKSGEQYSKSAYVNIRAGLNRYLTSPPNNQQINLMRDKVFMQANQVFCGVLRKMRVDGLDTTKHKAAIAPGDMEKLYKSGILSNDTPKSIQRKVYVEISLNFGRRGREGLRELTKNSIQIKTDDRGHEYATLSYNELDKTHQIQQPKDAEKKQLLYAKEDSDLCPIKTLKKYLAKLNPKCQSFFQRPKTLKNPETEEIWFENKSLGIHTIESFMKTMSTEAELSQIYTNHCLRATTSTVLANAGFDARNICSVTGHKNSQSLSSYVKEPTLAQRREMCSILNQYGKDELEEITDSSVIKSPPATCTVTKPTTGSLFAGAQFLGETTINVQMINKLE